MIQFLISILEMLTILGRGPKGYNKLRQVRFIAVTLTIAAGFVMIAFALLLALKLLS